MQQEVVEAEGHLIDSHVMEQIFDTVVEFNGRFEVEQFRIGKTNAEGSYLRLKVETPEALPPGNAAVADSANCWAWAARPSTPATPNSRLVERDCCAPEDFYSTTNHRTLVRHAKKWLEVENQRMDAMIVIGADQSGTSSRSSRRVLPPARFTQGRPGGGGDARHPGHTGIEGARPAGVRVHEQRHFLGTPGGNGGSSDRGADAAGARGGSENYRGGGPGGGSHRRRSASGEPDSRRGWVQALLAGNALGVHDIEASLLGTSLGVRQSDGRQEEHGHRNHMRAINAIYHAGGIAKAVDSGRLTGGVMYECVKARVPFVLAGSLRDDGPLPDTITDMNLAQDAYAEQLKGAGLVLCLGSMLHSIATGNMLPSWVKIVCVDINPAVATKVSDRGTGQAVGVVTDVGLFLDLLARTGEARAAPG